MGFGDMATCLKIVKTKSGLRAIHDFFTAKKSQKVRDENDANK